MKLRHAMIDLETLDIIPSAKIVSIGAVIFDPRYGQISDYRFYIELDHKAQINRTQDKDTIEWWKKQPPKVRKALKGTEGLMDALYELDFWLPDDVKVWGNGPTFDITMLEDAYRQLDMEIPWKYWNIRDYRTIRDLYECNRGGLDKTAHGTCHNALDDAYCQAKDVIKMWRLLLKQ